MKITTKDEFIRLSRIGALGNFLRSWDTLKELRKSGYRGPLTIRARDRQSPWFVPYAGGKSVRRRLAEIAAQGGPGQEAFYFQEVPHEGAMRVSNIEVMLDDREVMYAHIEPFTTNPVRGIRERTKPVTGAKARLILKDLIGEENYQTLYDIWEHYPTAIIEATVFTMACGAFGQYLVIWEVRDF